jgi:hypothetical protein
MIHTFHQSMCVDIKRILYTNIKGRIHKKYGERFLGFRT